MTQAEKMEALVQRAIERGFKHWSFSNALPGKELDVAADGGVSEYDILFNHDFARALFGEDKIEVYGGLWTKGIPKPTTIELHQVDAYLHHLQQAVISKDPIDYMYKVVFNE